VEAYVPGYGWYPMESTMGKYPWPNHSQINVAIVPTEHEAEAKARRRANIAGGVPFRTLVEMEPAGSMLMLGTVDRARFCDHVCRMVHPITADTAAWNALWPEAEKRWQTFLTTPKQLDAQGTLSFSPKTWPQKPKTLKEWTWE
jgi:hypothetical protein